MTANSQPAPHLYRLTCPDGLGFFRHRNAKQFAIGCAGVALALLGAVVTAAGLVGRLAFGIAGVATFIVGAARTPGGEEVVDLLGPVARFGARRARGRNRYAAALVPFRDAELPPLFAGITLSDLNAGRMLGLPIGTPGGLVGLVVDQADGSVSIVLRVHGEGFLLADPSEQDMRVGAFGQALASLGREDGAVSRVAWSQFSAPVGLESHRAYLTAAEREQPDAAMQAAYLELLEETSTTARRTEVLVALTVSLDRVRSSGRDSPDRLSLAIERLLEGSRLFAAELSRAGLTPIGPLPAGAIARSLRDRLDPSAMQRLERRGRSLADAVGMVSPENGFPLSIEEHRHAISTDETWHRVFRVAEWPRVAVRADFLAPFLCGETVTRSVTIVFSPQSRRLARRQALAVATRVGATIGEREQKGWRVGAEEHRAQLAAESLDEELEQGAGMELLVGLVDVTASSEFELAAECERTIQGAADVGIELRPVELRQGEALVASLPLGRVVLGRAR